MKILTQFILLFTITSLTDVFASPILGKRDSIDTVLTDLSDISTSVNSLDSSVNSLPQQGLVAALAVEQGVKSIISMLQKTQSDVLAASPFPLSDAVSILDAIQTLQPEIIQTLSDLVAQKSEVEKLNGELGGLAQLVELDLEALQSNTTAVENAFISAAQDSLNQVASSISSSIGEAFQTAISTFAD